MSSHAKKFALLGVGGFIAPRHLKAIQYTGNTLEAALDKHDSVGVLDKFFPNAKFFLEFERFDRHVEKLLRSKDQKIEYISICTPNYLHDAHIRFALRVNANAICEKPLVLNPWNVEALMEREKESDSKVWTIFQLRLHPEVIRLKEKFAKPQTSKVDIELTYVTPRGPWYDVSWKGDESKSGGIATNIGIHFFDMLGFVFGKFQKSEIHVLNKHTNSGFLEFEKARVRWCLSIDRSLLDNPNTGANRSLKIGGENFNFSQGFDDLHNVSYEQILQSKGYGLEDALSSIELLHTIRSAKPLGRVGDYHPLVAKVSE